MTGWRQALHRGLISGSVASLSSTAVLSACGADEQGTPYAPTNATSQWLWGEYAALQNTPSLRHTLPGYLIHHASSVFWAVIYEQWCGARRDSPAVLAARAAAIAGLACCVDLKLTPRRLRPGFEKRLSKRSLLLVYGSVAMGLAAASLLSQKTHR